jgi:hypothetical protein
MMKSSQQVVEADRFGRYGFVKSAPMQFLRDLEEMMRRAPAKTREEVRRSKGTFTKPTMV